MSAPRSNKIYLVTNSDLRAWVFKKKTNAEKFAKQKYENSLKVGNAQTFDVLPLQFSDWMVEGNGNDESN